jgi:hypothetical protein
MVATQRGHFDPDETLKRTRRLKDKNAFCAFPSRGQLPNPVAFLHRRINFLQAALQDCGPGNVEVWI